MKSLVNSTAEAVLRLAAAGCLVLAVLWTLGPNGAGVIAPAVLDVDQVEELATTPAVTSWAALPAAPVRLVDREDRDALNSAAGQLGAIDDGIAPAGYAEPSVGASAQFFDPPTSKRWLYVLTHALAWVGLAGVWWLLAGVVRTLSRGHRFTDANSSRLAIAGYLLVIGSPAVAIAQHQALGALLNTSTLAERAELAPYGVLSLPWAAIAGGMALLAIAAAWRRGVAPRGRRQGPGVKDLM